ncbi:aspartate/glutamate racemase family protein [Abyssisolibacter fermentans]|uniref:aspartate/glutamate racemase family protein n=1 Tax=Abyssisolibacter fermentans TaxID=1766203 RepID=UPI00082A049D|nr:amino acid racemase [Abyssisolibacter fermentans]
MSKILGIVGGMGPLATSILYKKIIYFTDAKIDQEHLNILINNNAAIPDRTEYILGKGESPLKSLIETSQNLEKAGADYLIMPCNTAHYFYDQIVSEINIPFLNMIEETAEYVISNWKIDKVGLLATKGTYISKVYDDIFERYNIEIVKPNQENTEKIMKFIYNIKAGREDIELDSFYNAKLELEEKGVDVFILGCTELSTAYDLFDIKGQFVDPLEIIAKKAIAFGGKKIK